MNESEKRTCIECERSDPEATFNKDRHSPDGISRRCAECKARRSKKWRQSKAGNPKWKKLNKRRFDGWYADNRDQVVLDMKTRHAKEMTENPAALMVRAKRRRAKQDGIEFSITAKDISVPKYCPVLGLELRMNIGGTGPADNSPSIDRKDPTRGYVPGNVQVISFRANTLKNNATIEELEKLVAFLKRQDTRFQGST
jgi:hypothetical protein